MEFEIQRIMSVEEWINKIALFYKGKYWVPLATEESAKAVESFQPRDDDVIVATYPKSGSHWMVELVRLIHANGKQENIDRSIREGMLEGAEFRHQNDITIRSGRRPICELMKEWKSPRPIMTHMHAEFIPNAIWTKNTPVINIARQPRDVCLSYYKFCRDSVSFCENADDFFTQFFVPGIRAGSWFDHVRGYWNMRDKPNVLIVTYEEMKKDLREVVMKVSRLMGKELDEQSVARIIHHASASEMKKHYLYITDMGYGDLVRDANSRKLSTLSEENEEKLSALIREKMVGCEELLNRMDIDV